MMNKNINTFRFTGLVLFLVLSLTSFAQNKVTLLVEFNGANHNIEQNINYSEKMSVLDALMMVATIQTHPVEKYVFVDAINNVYNVKGKNAWYFTVNGKPSKVLAINRTLAKGDVVKWIYKKDVCSKTIDTKEPCPDNFGM